MFDLPSWVMLLCGLAKVVSGSSFLLEYPELFCQIPVHCQTGLIEIMEQN